MNIEAPVNQLFSRIKPSRTADEVISQIEQLILEGVLRVGDRLPGERDLVDQFEVSRPIVREALKNLQERGLLVSRHGGGTYVADVIGPVFSKPVMELIAAHREATVDYLEYRREIDGIAAEFAARRATANDREILSDIMRRMEAAHEKDDFSEEAEADVDFHNAIGEAAHNIILLHTLRACYRLLSDGVFLNRAMIYELPGARDKLLAQHRRFMTPFGPVTRTLHAGRLKTTCVLSKGFMPKPNAPVTGKECQNCAAIGAIPPDRIKISRRTNYAGQHC